MPVTPADPPTGCEGTERLREKFGEKGKAIGDSALFFLLGKVDFV